MSPADLIQHAASRGVRLRAVGGVLRCLSAGPLPDDLRDLLTTHKAELLAHLADPPRPRPDLWGRRTALRLMEAADELVEHLGADGRQPEVIEAAARVTGAYATRDLQAIRLAIAAFTTRVAALAAPHRCASDPADGNCSQEHNLWREAGAE
jgi:hypothetical protein